MESSEADVIIYGSLIFCAVAVALLAWWGIRSTKETEQTGAELTVDKVKELYGNRVLSNQFLWAVWQKLLSAKTFELHVKNELGEQVATIYINHMTLGNEKRVIEVGGKRYHVELENLNLMLKETGKPEILMRSRHKGLKQQFFVGDELYYELCPTFITKDYTAIKRHGEEVGQLIDMFDLKCNALMLTTSDKKMTQLQQLFILASCYTR